MTPEQLAAMEQALGALDRAYEISVDADDEHPVDWALFCEFLYKERTALRTVIEQAKRQQALDKMAEDERRLGIQMQQEPVAWKLVPVEPTKEMLKAMDECSTEGYDERLYAGHAASVYMAAVDVAPTPPQRPSRSDIKPLTDEQIILIVAECASSHQHTDIHFARAIEAAHGIKGEA